MASIDIISIVLALSVPVALGGGIINRCVSTRRTAEGETFRGKGLGWQFIRYSVLVTGMPLVCILALNDIVEGSAAISFLSLAFGYAFGKSTESAASKKKVAP